MPKVSVVMPVYNSAKYLSESIESIRNQTFTNWEFIIVNEFGSNDGSSEIIQRYSQMDSRIILLQNDERLGLAQSLNEGIKHAKGEYIARVDADDPSYPLRFEKQVTFMDANPDISLCGTLQRSVTPKGNSVQIVPCESDELKAALLFGCEISHCSVMLRKLDFDSNNWRYNPAFLGEDYELWTRIMTNTKFANLDEVLVDHRWGYDNISIAKGEKLRQEVREISARTLKLLDINMPADNLLLLSGWRNRPEAYAKENTAKFLKEGFALLDLIEKQNNIYHIFEPKALKKILHKRWDWICETCGLKLKQYESNNQFSAIVSNPVVSVVMPVYNSAKHLREAIDSVLEQTFSNWEFLVVNESSSEDGSAEIVKAYAKYDNRIHLIQNEEKLGLGDSLNRGFRLAKGKYLARLDADDLAHPTRFEKQVAFMEENPYIGVCGAYQHHFGPNTNWIHKPPITSQQCKANLLFYCDLCHSTLMLRKDVFLQNHLFYDNHYLAEDFELWTRAIAVTDFANIPEVLGEYRWAGNNITIGKEDKLMEESGLIVVKALKQYLHMDIPVEHSFLFNNRRNLYVEEKNNDSKNHMLDQLKEYLQRILEQNNKYKFFNNQSLLNIVALKWRWAKYNEIWDMQQEVSGVEEIFDASYSPSFLTKLKRFLHNNPTLKEKVKKILKKVIRPFIRPLFGKFEMIINASEQRILKHVNDMTWDRYKRIEQKVDNKVWEAEKKIIDVRDSLNSLVYRQNLTPFYGCEKIRIVFLFQVASFWPSWESFYRSCIDDSRFDVVFAFLDETVVEKSQMKTARDFLESQHIPYKNYNELDLEAYRPHVIVYQTPYDYWHRTKAHWSSTIKKLGIRIVYIPYGIEIADTPEARKAHFDEDVVSNAWRVYTFSKTMLEDYKAYSLNVRAVKVSGLPKFDALYNTSHFTNSGIVSARANGRKIILWKVHFPKLIDINGSKKMVTPFLEEYLKFASVIKNYPDLFFVFMPHPKFGDSNDDFLRQEALELLHMVSGFENVYVDTNDDYRLSLINANYIIIDRSAVMVEAGAVGVPVLYMSNSDFSEPLTQAITPLIESYYQGTSCADMVDFVEMCIRGEDPKKWERNAAFRQTIPYFDGKCGERIKEDIIDGMNMEQLEQSLSNQEIVNLLEKRHHETEDRLLQVLNSRLASAEKRVLQAEEQLTILNGKIDDAKNQLYKNF